MITDVAESPNMVDLPLTARVLFRKSASIRLLFLGLTWDEIIEATGTTRPTLANDIAEYEALVKENEAKAGNLELNRAMSIATFTEVKRLAAKDLLSLPAIADKTKLLNVITRAEESIARLQGTLKGDSKPPNLSLNFIKMYSFDDRTPSGETAARVVAQERERAERYVDEVTPTFDVEPVEWKVTPPPPSPS